MLGSTDVHRFILGLLGTVVGTTVLLGLKAPNGRPADAVAGATREAAPDAPAETTAAAGTARDGAPARRMIVGVAYPARDYGTVQVKVAMTGQHIDDILVLRMSNRPADAPARLRREALTKQTANLSIVSGATYTSQAYMRSLQSALAKA
jgi:uncharacterized protein with FMN-binding domain